MQISRKWQRTTKVRIFLLQDQNENLFAYKSSTTQGKASLNKMAAINVSSNDPLYLAYRSAGPSADLIVPAVALYAVVLVGIVLNGTVLVVTVKSKSLRGSANFLMAILCLFEMFHQIGHTFFFVVVVSGTNFVSLLTADIILAPMIFALNCSLMAMFCAAFDRLFAVAAPQRHLYIYAKFKCAYLLGHLLICTIYGAFTLNYVLVYALENAANPTTGVVAETFMGLVGYKFFGGALILGLCSACCYLAIFVIIRSKNGVTQQTNTRLLRSMVIILSVSIGGYMITVAMYQFLFEFGMQIFGSPIRLWQFGFIAGILLNAGAGSNAVILFFNSTEYRRCFKKEWDALAQRIGLKNATQSSAASNHQLRSLNPNNNITVRVPSQNVQSIQLNRY